MPSAGHSHDLTLRTVHLGGRQGSRGDIAETTSGDPLPWRRRVHDRGREDQPPPQVPPRESLTTIQIRPQQCAARPGGWVRSLAGRGTYAAARQPGPLPIAAPTRFTDPQRTSPGARVHASDQHERDEPLDEDASAAPLQRQSLPSFLMVLLVIAMGNILRPAASVLMEGRRGGRE